MWYCIYVSENTLLELSNNKNILKLEKTFKYERLEVGDIVELHVNDKLHDFFVIITAKEVEHNLEFEVGLLPNLGTIEMFNYVKDTDDEPEALAISMNLDFLKHNRDPMVTTITKPQWMIDIFNKHNAYLGHWTELPQFRDSDIYKRVDAVRLFNDPEDSELIVAYDTEEKRFDQEHNNWDNAVEECYEYINNFRKEFEQQNMTKYHGFDQYGIYKLTVGEFRPNLVNKTTSTNCCYNIDISKTATMVAKTGQDFIQNLQICTGSDYDGEYYIEKLWYDLKSNTYVVCMGRY